METLVRPPGGLPRDNWSRGEAKAVLRGDPPNDLVHRHRRPLGRRPAVDDDGDTTYWHCPRERVTVATKDHTVPQFYLRRLARTGSGRSPQLMAAPVENLGAAFLTSPRNVAVEDGFHWGIDPDGVPHHYMEVLMTAIEGAAVPAFSHLLDTTWALPERWPPMLADPIRLSWWVAAQVLRTTR